MKPNLKSVPSTHPLTESEQLEIYCKSWRQFKAAESEANEARVEIENQIIKHVGFSKLEGSTTVKNANYKISLTSKLDRKLDVEAYNKIADQLPENMRPIKTKIELDVTGVKWMEKNQPEYVKLVHACITTKPAKTAVKVEFIGAE